MQTVGGSGESLGVYPPASSPLLRGNIVPILLRLGSYDCPATSGNVFSRAVLEQILPMPEIEYRLCADAYLTHVAPFYGLVESIDEPLAAYRFHGGNGWMQPMLRRGSEDDGSRFRASLMGDLQKRDLVASVAHKLGYYAPPDASLRNWEFLRVRLASLRLEPRKHPIPGERPVEVVCSGIDALWRYSVLNLRRRLVHSVWFGVVGLLPLPAAKVGIAWAFAPAVLPASVTRVLGFLRAKLVR